MNLYIYMFKSSPEIIERRPESKTIELLSAAMFRNVLPHDFYTRTLIYGGQKRLCKPRMADQDRLYAVVCRQGEFTVSILLVVASCLQLGEI
jgi:hypothetical protein